MAVPTPNPNLPADRQDVATIVAEVEERSPPPTFPTRSRKKQPTITFCEAMRRVATGSRVTRVEWGDANYYGFLKDAWLMIHKPDGTDRQWLLSDGDILADDWYELPEA